MSSKSSSVAHPKIKWTSEMETALINLIEKKPHLWDSKNENYLKKNLKHHSFKEIGDTLKERWPEYSLLFTHEGLVNKFANLRSYYRREWKKLKQIRSAGEGESFVPKWDHFVHLNFLEEALLRESVESSLDSTPLELCEVTMPSEVILPDSEVDNRDSARETSCPKARRSSSLLFSNGEESYHRKKFKRNPSTDDSSNDASNSTSNQVMPYLEPAPSNVTSLPSISLRTEPSNKDSADSAFCHYLYTMLLTIPDGFEKEMAKIRIMETILKLKYPQG